MLSEINHIVRFFCLSIFLYVLLFFMLLSIVFLLFFFSFFRNSYVRPAFLFKNDAWYLKVNGMLILQ